MPTETQDEPLHPAFAEHDAAREAFLNEASEVFEARRTPINPLADKLSQATLQQATPKAEQDTSNASSSRSPASTSAAPQASNNADAPTPGKIPGISELGLSPGDSKTAETQRASQAPQSSPDFDEGVLTPDEYQKGKTSRDHFTKLFQSKESWKKLAKEREQVLEQLKRNGTQNGVPQPDPKIAEQIKSLSNENANLLARLEAVAVEKSPRFEAAFKPRIEAAIAQAKAAVGPERAARIESLLQQPESAYRDEQIESMLSEMGTSLRAGKLQTAVADLDRINAERAAMASRGSELFKQWQSEENTAMQRQRQEREQQALQAFDSELQGWKDYVKPEDVELARDVYIGKADLTAAARASLWAVAGPKIARMNIEKDKRIAELEGELSKLRSVQPGRDNAGGAPTGSDDEDPSKVSYMDRVANEVRKAGLLR